MFTNDKFIIEKKEEKFELAWLQMMETLPCSGKIAFVISGKTFYKRNHEKRECFIICNQVEYTKGTTDEATKVILSKYDLKRAFVHYKDYENDLKRAKYELMRGNRHFCGEDDSFNEERARKREMSRLNYEREYVRALLAKFGCGLYKEEYIDKLELINIEEYINEMKKIGKFSAFYYEFRAYDRKMLNALIKENRKISDVLYGEMFKEFVLFCINNGVKTFYDVMYFPFYAKNVVDFFGVELIDLVIKNIKGTIDIFMLDYNGLDGFDVEDFE